MQGEPAKTRPCSSPQRSTPPGQTRCPWAWSRAASGWRCLPQCTGARSACVWMGIKGRKQPACLRSAAASCSCLRQRGTQMHGSVRGCRLVRAPSLRITVRGHAHLLVSQRLLLLAVLLATESQLVGFGAAIGRRYDAAARHQRGLLHAAPHWLLASRIGLGWRRHRCVKKKACARARQQPSGVSCEWSLPPATGEHCLLAMPLRERVRPVVSGDAKPTEPQSGAHGSHGRRAGGRKKWADFGPATLILIKILRNPDFPNPPLF